MHKAFTEHNNTALQAAKLLVATFFLPALFMFTTFCIISIEITEGHTLDSTRAKAVYVLGIASAVQVAVQYFVAQKLTQDLHRKMRWGLVLAALVCSVVTTVAIATSSFDGLFL